MRKLFKKRKESPKIIKIDLRDLQTEIILIESDNVVFEGKMFSMNFSYERGLYGGQEESRLSLEFYRI
jgi:hypothetical protein